MDIDADLDELTDLELEEVCDAALEVAAGFFASLPPDMLEDWVNLPAAVDSPACRDEDDPALPRMERPRSASISD